jgi:hypothetical protein
MSGSNNDLGGYNRPPPPPYVPPTAAPVNATDFDPFAALGLHPATATVVDLRPAYLRSMRHRHEAAIARFPATATHFPSQVQVQQAYDYLSAGGTIATARNRWSDSHVAVFFPRLAPGDPAAFAPAAGPATAAAAAGPAAAAAAGPSTATPNRPTAAAAAAAATPATGSSYHPSSGASSSGPRKARRTAATGSGSSPATGTADNPLSLSSSDDDASNGRGSPTPAPMNLRSRPAAAAAAATGSGPAAVGRPAPRRRAPARTANRSGGSSSRNSSVPNPVLGERITVGTWANATAAATPNAVVAGFDARGRIFYRIINEDANGNAVAAPTATATRFEDINFRAPYQNMTADQVRTAIDQHLRLNPFLRP